MSSGAARSARRYVLAAAVAGFIVRLAIALGDIGRLDRLFVPDDTYYTLAIARSMSRGDGPSIGGVLTNGFQPLLAFLLVPVARLGASADGLLRASWIVGALADGVSIYLLGLVAMRAPGRRWLVGTLAAALWAVSPIATANALNGLETAVATSLSLAVVQAAIAASDRPSTGRELWAGATSGLALLARIDAVFLVALIGLVELLRRGPRRLVLRVSAALAVVGPWWAYELARFGTIVPMSGAAVREQAAVHRAIYLTTPKQVAWSFGTLAGTPFFDVPALRDGLMEHAWLGVLLASASAIAIAWCAWTFARSAGPGGPILAAWLGSALVTWAFYALWVPALWFFRRYLAPVECVVTFLFAWAIERAWSLRAAIRWPLLAAAAVMACIAVVFEARWFSLDPPGGTLDVSLHGAKGYRGPALAILRLLPEGAVVGALQSGALSYYAPTTGRDIRVVNLDGVVDRYAAKAFRERRMSTYLRERGVGYLADWSFNFFALSQRLDHPLAARTIGRAPAQGPDRFVLVRLVP